MFLIFLIENFKNYNIIDGKNNKKVAFRQKKYYLVYINIAIISNL